MRHIEAKQVEEDERAEAGSRKPSTIGPTELRWVIDVGEVNEGCEHRRSRCGAEASEWNGRR